MKKRFIYDGKETNYEISSDGKVFNIKTGKELKGATARNEYRSVQLTIGDHPKTFMIHRLVAQTFLDNPNNYTIVDHIDRNKMNNDVSNLRWVDNMTNARNCQRKINSKRKYFYGAIDQKWRPLLEDNNYYASEDGEILNIQTRCLLQGSKRNGYTRICLPDGGYKSKHVLIWEAFNGRVPDNMVIDHIDGDKSNNALKNLRVISQSENMKNAQRNGHKGQIPISQYDSKGNFIKKYTSIQKAANAVGVTEAAVKTAANKYGSSAGYLWIRDDQDITIDELLKKTRAKIVKRSSDS